MNRHLTAALPITRYAAAHTIKYLSGVNVYSQLNAGSVVHEVRCQESAVAATRQSLCCDFPQHLAHRHLGHCLQERTDNQLML